MFSRISLLLVFVVCLYVLGHLVYEGLFFEAFFPTGILVFLMLFFVIKKFQLH